MIEGPTLIFLAIAVAATGIYVGWCWLRDERQRKQRRRAQQVAANRAEQSYGSAGFRWQE